MKNEAYPFRIQVCLPCVDKKKFVAGLYAVFSAFMISYWEKESERRLDERFAAGYSFLRISARVMINLWLSILYVRTYFFCFLITYIILYTVASYKSK